MLSKFLHGCHSQPFHKSVEVQGDYKLLVKVDNFAASYQPVDFLIGRARSGL